MSRRRPLLASVITIALSLPVSVAAALTAGADEPPPPEVGLPLATGEDLPAPPGRPLPPGPITPGVLQATGEITVFVELDAPSGLDTVEAGGDLRDVAAAAAAVEQLADDVVPAPRARAARGTPRQVTVTTAVVAGALVTGDADQLRELAADPAVNAVHLVVPKTSTAKSADAFTRALDAWVATGATGDGVSIGIIDTGIDYTHATFGGSGTESAYADAYGPAGQGTVPDGSFDPAKLLGGYDFAGPLYDADPASTIPGASPFPDPDANPIDARYTAGGAGHGTHVAASAAGYGVLADGTTFDGDYATLTDISDWRIGPGSAPEAGVYALKVFGDAGGSTALTVAALDWAADPNGDNDFSDRLDVVNLSLGSDFDPVDDPENLFIDRLAEIGVLTVASAGNDGDVTDVGGSPGNAASALTVANSVAGLQSFDAVEVVAVGDPALVGLHAAQLSEDYTGPDVTAPVVHLGDVTGCTSLEEYAEVIADQIVWLQWDDDDANRPCGTFDRWQNAEAAGAAGVLIGTTLPAFPAAIAGNEGIPGARLTAAATVALLPQIQAGGVVARIGPSLRGAVVVPVPSVADTLNSDSSRGVHGSLGVVKPDVAAPGTRITSAASGTGAGQVTYSGSSMSAPHVTGIAALIAQTHPDWSPAQIKAAVMNTATHDVHAGQDGSGPVYGPERVGAGRVDALDAVAADVIAFATDAPGLVTVAFGVVPVGDTTVVEQRTVTLQNTSGQDRRYATSFAQATAAGGAGVTASPAEVTVPAGGSAQVTLTLTADPATLARTIDPTSASWYDLGDYVPREYVATLSGRLVLTPADGAALRVPVHAAPRLVSDLVTEPVEFAGAESAPLEITGRGVASGGWLSLMAPMALVASSPTVPEPGLTTSPSAVGAGDLAMIGISSTAPQLVAAGYDPAAYGTLALGVTTHGEWASLGSSVVPIIDTDTDSDGIWDAETYVWKYGPGLDFTVVMTYALEFDGTGYSYGELLELYPVNGLWADYDTTVFDNDVLVVPMGLGALGIAPGDVATFVVATYSRYAPDGSGYVDVVGPFSADPYDPPVWFDGGPGSAGSLWFAGQPGSDVTVHRRADVASAELLVLHTHNRSGERAQVVTAASRDASTLTVAGPRRMPAGLPVPVLAVVRSSGATPTGTVQILDGDQLLATAPLTARGRVGAALLVLPRTLSVGHHHLTVRYSGNASVAPSSASYDLRIFSVGRPR
jgi:subtilisin family serine protease